MVKNSFKKYIKKFYETKGKFNFYNVYLYDVFGTGDKRNKIFRQIILSINQIKF